MVPGRIVVLGGWRAYVLGAALLVLVLAALIAASVVVVTALAIGAVALVSYRALRALGLVRPNRRRASGRVQVIEGRYEVVERRLPDRS